MSRGETDYYAALGVPEDASAATIEGAYRERVKEVHPDRSDAPDAAEQFRLVQAAKEVLTDPTERARYDRLGHDAYVRRTAGPGPAPSAQPSSDPGPTDGRSSRTAGRRAGSGRSRQRSSRRSRTNASGSDGGPDDTAGTNRHDGSGDGEADDGEARWGEASSAWDDEDEAGPDDRTGGGADWATDGSWRNGTSAAQGGPGPDGTGADPMGPGATGRDERGANGCGSDGGGLGGRHGATTGGAAAGHPRADAARERIWRRQGPRGRRSERARERARRRRARDGSGDRAGDGSSRHAAADYATGWYASGADSDAGYGVSPGSGPGFVSERVGLAAMAFALYPLFAFGAFGPWLAPGARVALGLLGLSLVGYLVYTPEAGLLAFGAWTLLAPFVLVAAGVGVVSLAGTLAWAACWVPFLFCGASLVFRYR